MTEPGPTPLILAGGLGTRLAGTVPGLPKALVPVRGRPFVTYLLEQLGAAGFRRAVLSVGHMADAVERALGADYHGMALTYVREQELRGTGGALRLAVEAVDTAHCLAMNGDSYCHLDLVDFVTWHAGRPEPVGMALAEVRGVERYGSVTADDSGRVLRFEEKAARLGRGWINAGVYLIPSRLLRAIDPDRVISLERDIFPSWVEAGMAGYRTLGAFIDVGTPQSYREAELFFAVVPHAEAKQSS